MTAHPVIAAPPALVRVTLPLRTVSEANGQHGHWAARARRRKAQRGLACTVVGAHWRCSGLALPVVVVLTRIAPSSGLDDDNLRVALKSVRDGVADALGLDDRDPRVAWQYAQRRPARRLGTGDESGEGRARKRVLGQRRATGAEELGDRKSVV